MNPWKKLAGRGRGRRQEEKEEEGRPSLDRAPARAPRYSMEGKKVTKSEGGVRIRVGVGVRAKVRG
jgi:hypothetical protein